MSTSSPGASPDAAGDAGPPPLRRLGRHTLIYGSGHVATAAVSMILIPVYTHYLSPAEFGLLALMLVLYGVGKQVYDLGFTNSVARFYFDETGGVHGLHGMRATSLAFLAAYGTVLTAALWLFAGAWSDLLTGTRGHADLVRIVAVTLLADAIAIVPLTLLRMQERSGVFLAVTIVRLVTSLALGVLFVAGLEWGVRGALLAVAIPAGLVLIIALSLDRPSAGEGRASWVLLRRMLAFGLPFFPVLVSGWVIDASDRYLLELLRSREEVGYYSLAYRVGQVMQIAVAAFIMGWAPLREQIRQRADAPSVYGFLTTYFVIAAAFLGVGLGVFAEEIVTLAAPSSYRPAGEVIGLIVLAYALQGTYFLMATGMGVAKRTAALAGIAVAGATLNIALNLVLIPDFGMRGAATATVCAYVATAFGAWYASGRVYPIPYDWLRMGQVAVIAIAVVAVTSLLSPEQLAASSAVALLGWAAFVVLLISTGLVRRSELDAARRQLRGMVRWRAS